MLISEWEESVRMYDGAHQALLRCAVRRFGFMGSPFLLSGRRPSLIRRSEE